MLVHGKRQQTSQRPRTLGEYTLPRIPVDAANSGCAGQLLSRIFDSGKIRSTTFSRSQPEDSDLENSGIGTGAG